jgi:hypothetical protein
VEDEVLKRNDNSSKMTRVTINYSLNTAAVNALLEIAHGSLHVYNDDEVRVRVECTTSIKHKELNYILNYFCTKSLIEEKRGMHVCEN